jgi:hypothetical protein
VHLRIIDPEQFRPKFNRDTGMFKLWGIDEHQGGLLDPIMLSIRRQLKVERFYLASPSPESQFVGHLINMKVGVV